MRKESPIQKPDIGGTLSPAKRVIFSIFLIFFISASVYMSFNMISRDTYEFEYTDNYNGTGESGWIFNGFNGNASTDEVHIGHPITKQNGKWVETDGDVIAVDSYTFISDEYVKYIYIGASVTHIEKEAFVYCKQLRAFYVDENNPNYVSVNGVLYSKDMKEIIAYPPCHCTQIVLDDVAKSGKVENIGRENIQTHKIDGVYVKDDEEKSTLYAAFKSFIKNDYSGDFDSFNEFSEFSILMDNNVYAPYIGTYYLITEKTDNGITIERFWTCDEAYVIPDGVETIANKAFYKCDRLTAVTIPQSVTKIGDMAFFNLWRLTSITLPDNLTEIGNDTFSYCSGIRHAVYIPGSVKAIGHHCFYKCNDSIDFYMGDADKSTISLGGRWQPRSDNSFKAKSPIWNKTRAEYDAYMAPLIAEDERAAAEAAAAGNVSQATEEDAMNKNALIIIIVAFFIPGFLYIGVQVIRAIFKDDFLMTKKGKIRLQKAKEEKEKIHQSYLEQNKKETDDKITEEGGNPDE